MQQVFTTSGTVWKGPLPLEDQRGFVTLETRGGGQNDPLYLLNGER